MEKEVLEKMYERIKKPINEFIIPNSVPVVYFGDYEKAKACTIALHPSHNETLFYRPRLGISHEDELTDKDAEYVLEKCNHYFENETYIYHSFFDPNEYMINKFAYSYYKDKNKNLCVQLNLVQWLANGWRTILEPTKEKDFEFLEVLLNNGNFERIFLNGIVVKEYMQRIHTFELTGFANEKQFLTKYPLQHILEYIKTL